MYRNIAILLATATLVGACSSNAVDTPAEGRLVILDDSGNIVTMAPDGTDVVTVADDGGGRVAYFQPIWSPDGSRISSTRSEAGTFSIEIVGVEGGDRTRTATSSNSFYQYWSPDGSKLGSLSVTGPGVLGLDVFTIGDMDNPVRVGEGQPLYFSWSPDSSDAVAHIGDAPLEILFAEDSATDFGAPGDFSAPQWTEAGIVHVTVASRRQQVVRTRADAETEVVASVPNGAIFTASPDGQRIAVLPTARENVGMSVIAQEIPVLSGGRLVIVDGGDGTFVDTDAGIVVSFAWDPTGERLLVLEITDRDEFRWRVWEGGESRTYPEFVPPPGFIRDVVPFFDQYAQSMTLWSPDGSAFAFAGAVGEETGVWRQDLEVGDPVRIAGGTWVAWSSD